LEPLLSSEQMTGKPHVRPAFALCSVGRSCYTNSLQNLRKTKTIVIIANKNINAFETFPILAFTAKIIAAIPSMQT
jgi:NADPH:quinone reductase-like Zn-dependent oxidoreductase